MITTMCLILVVFATFVLSQISAPAVAKQNEALRLLRTFDHQSGKKVLAVDEEKSTGNTRKLEGEIPIPEQFPKGDEDDERQTPVTRKLEGEIPFPEQFPKGDEEDKRQTPVDPDLVDLTDDPQPQNCTEAPPSPPFNRAISYVTTIKTRFTDDPTTYHSFLEILGTYQNEQRGVEEVLEEVVRLFADHPDLLKEFTFFLPERVQEQAKERLHRAAAESEARQAAERTQQPGQSEPTGFRGTPKVH